MVNKIATKDEKLESFQAELEAEREWRIAELVQVRLIYRKFELEGLSDELTVFSSMTIPTIYAHWEGYCKKSFSSLLKFINLMNLKPNQIQNSLLTHAYNRTYNSLKGKQSFKQRCSFTENFTMQLDKTIKFEIEIDTKSNLNAEVLESILNIFGLDIQKFEECLWNLNKLVNIRNSIAHGKHSVVVSKEMFEANILLITNMIDLVLMEQVEYVNSKKYIREQ